MGDFSQVLGGLLSGYGQGLVKQGEIDQQNARDDALMRRELALAQAKSRADFALEAWKADRKDQSTKMELGLRAGIDAAKTEAENSEWYKRQKVLFENEKAKLGIQLNNEQTKIAFQAQQDIAKYNATEGQDNPVHSTKVDADGHLIGILKDGTIKDLAPGIKFPQPMDMTALLMGGGLGGGGQTETDAPAAPRGLPSVQSQAPAAAPQAPAANTYTQAEYDAGLAKYANQRMNQLQREGKPINSAQIRGEWNDMLRKQGLRLRAGN